MSNPNKDAKDNLLEVESADVIRLILQFLKENNLHRSLFSLQEETRVALGCVDSLEQYTADIQHGRWDAVLQTAGFISYPEEALHILYEQVVCEMIEMNDCEVARQLLKETSSLQSLCLIHPERFKRLEQFCSRGQVDPKELYEGSSKEKRRGRVAEVLLREVRQVPPSRLLTLLGMASRWQHHQGLLPANAKFDLFRGMVAVTKDQEEECVARISKTVPFGVKSHLQCAVFSPNGQYLITGSVDGIIEVLDALTANPRNDLDYQAKEEPMVHDKAVLSLEVSRDSAILASGSSDGQLKLWRIQSGQCVKKIDRAHSAGITSIQFSRDSTHVLTASLDGTARIHGLKSGKMLGTFRGHDAYVNTAIFTADSSKVITGGSDGRVKVWDARTFDCLQSLSPPPPCHLGEPTQAACVNRLFLSNEKSSQDTFFACTKSNTLYVLNTAGQVVKSFSSGKRENGDFVCAAASPGSQWIYCAGEDNTIYCFSNATGKLENVIIEAHKADVFGLTHHPHQNLVASWGYDGALNLYQP